MITACFYRQTLSSKRIWFATAMAALLGVAAVSNCRAESRESPSPPAQKETAKTPPLTQAAGGPVLVGSVGPGKTTTVTFVGAWNPKTGWRNAANAEEDKELMPDGTVWTLYGLNQPPLRVASGPVRLVWPFEHLDLPAEPEHCDVTAKLTRNPRGKYPLAVSGIDFMDEGLVRVLLPQEDPNTKRLCEYLLENGLVKKVEKIHQVVRADLDGDGKEEHLVAFHGNIWAYYAPNDEAYPANNSVIAAAHMTDSGTYRVSMLTEMAQIVLRGSHFGGRGVLGAEILAIADINGDGRREVVISTNGADWWAFEVYAFDGKRFQKVLFFGGYWA